MKYRLIILLSLFTSALSAQPESSDTLEVDGQFPVIQKINKRQLDSAQMKLIYAFHEPEGGIYTDSYDNKYFILLQTQTDTVYWELPRNGNLYEDSIRCIQVNGRGFRELMLYYHHEYAHGYEFEGYQYTGTIILVCDLDKRELILNYQVNDFSSESKAYFLDSLGNEVFLDNEQLGVLMNGEGEEYAYLESLSQYYSIRESKYDCNYRLSNKKLILNCLYSEEQEATNNSEAIDSTPMQKIHLEYKLVNDQWILQKKRP